MVAVVEEIEGIVVLPERARHGLDSGPAPENRAAVAGATLGHRTQGVNQAPGAIDGTEHRISAIADHLESASEYGFDPGVSLEAHL